MTRPLAITAKTPTASNTCVHTPAGERKSCWSGAGAQQLHSPEPSESLSGLVSVYSKQTLMGPEVCRLRSDSGAQSSNENLVKLHLALVLCANRRDRCWSRDQPRAEEQNRVWAVIVLLLVALTNIVGLPGNQAPLESDHFDGIQADLKYVVDESQKRRERERSHEYGSEAKLDHWRRDKQFYFC